MIGDKNLCPSVIPFGDEHSEEVVISIFLEDKRVSDSDIFAVNHKKHPRQFMLSYPSITPHPIGII